MLMLLPLLMLLLLAMLLYLFYYSSEYVYHGYGTFHSQIKLENMRAAQTMEK